MFKVGLTGGIGSGKSVVAKIFNVLGIPVFNADQEAKNLMATDPMMKQQLLAAFGQETFIDGTLNRIHLSNQVFNDQKKLAQLNAIVHPATISAANDWINKQQSPYVIKEAALLFEANSAKHLDYVIGVFAPEQLRLQRVIDRDGLTTDQVQSRMNKQMNEEEKMKLCDAVLINDEQQLLTIQVLELHEKLSLMASS